MKTFKQYLNESKIIRAYHGSNTKWDWNEDDLPKNKFQRQHYSSNKKDEAKKYGKHIHVQDIDTTNYKTVEHKDNVDKAKIISGAIRKGHSGLIFKNSSDKDGIKKSVHDEIITFDHKTIKKIGYEK